MSKPCSSYKPGFVCVDGFVQKPICHGSAGCWSCGTVLDATVPNCCKDELPAHWLNDDGTPFFYRGGRKCVG